VRPYLENTQHKKGLVEWLKVKALSLNLSTIKKIYIYIKLIEEPKIISSNWK
jgi:hypothetical protein